VEIQTPLLASPLQGPVYLAEQDRNPFSSLLAIYIAAEGEGARVKLAGHVEADPLTGQLKTTFHENPQLPFDELRLRLFGGPQGVLATPPACGSYTSEASLSPWDGLGASALSEQFEILMGAGGGACPPGGALPFNPAMSAGTVANQAGGFSPFTFSLSRNDGEQRFAGASVTMPPGLEGVLTGVPLCGEEQANAGTCGAQSQIGQASVSAGVGPEPVGIAGGRVYLTGPYNGGPFGLSIVVPAVAGPFDLGDVVVRASIRVDPHTAQITVLSDPLPQMVDSVEGRHSGIPADLRSIAVAIDRPGFTFNPTDCEALSVGATVTGVLPGAAPGTSVGLAGPFHAVNCGALKFEPSVTLSTPAKASKLNGAALTFRVAYPRLPGGRMGALGAQSWLREAKFELPKQLPARLGTIQQACLARAFETNRSACPAHSIIGHAVVHTPVLPVPLQGPVYFVSYGGAAFPDAVLVLDGYGVHIELHGNTFIDSKTGVTSATFKSTPDVPFESIEVTLPQGPYSEFGANLGGSYDFCGRKLVMPTEFQAQNGLEIVKNTPVTVTGCGKPLTNKQKLAAALRACKRRHGRKRASCEQAARARYGARTPGKRKH